MTRMTHSPVSVQQPLLRQPVELSWSAVAAGDDPRLALQSSRPREVSLCVRMVPQENDEVVMNAATVEYEHVKPLIIDARMSLSVIEDGALLHATMIDSDGTEMLALSLRLRTGHDPEVLYARTPLLNQAGFTGGRSDPPRIRPVNA